MSSCSWPISAQNGLKRAAGLSARAGGTRPQTKRARVPPVGAFSRSPETGDCHPENPAGFSESSCDLSTTASVAVAFAMGPPLPPLKRGGRPFVLLRFLNPCGQRVTFRFKRGGQTGRRTSRRTRRCRQFLFPTPRGPLKGFPRRLPVRDRDPEGPNSLSSGDARWGSPSRRHALGPAPESTTKRACCRQTRPQKLPVFILAEPIGEEDLGRVG
jgi:hypothetical protein